MTTPPDAAHPTPPAPLDGARLTEWLEELAQLSFLTPDELGMLRALAAALPGLLDRQREAERLAENERIARGADLQNGNCNIATSYQVPPMNSTGGASCGNCGSVIPPGEFHACPLAKGLYPCEFGAARTPSPEAPRV